MHCSRYLVISLSNLSRAAARQKENRRWRARRGHGELACDWSPLGVSEYFVGGWELLYKAFHGSWYIAVALTCCFTVATEAFLLRSDPVRGRSKVRLDRSTIPPEISPRVIRIAAPVTYAPRGTDSPGVRGWRMVRF